MSAADVVGVLVVLVVALVAVAGTAGARALTAGQGPRRAELARLRQETASLQATLDAVEELLLPERGSPAADVVLERIRADERARRPRPG